MSTRRRRTRAKIADPADVEAFVEGLSEKYLMCRRYGHSFKPHTAKLSREFRGYDTTKRCSTCHYIVRELFDMELNFIKTLPDYPPGYLMKGMGRIAGEGRNIVRAEMLQRQLAGTRKSVKQRRLKAV